MSLKHLRVLVSVGFVSLLSLVQTAPALAEAVAPSLGAADSFAVLAASTVTNTGLTVITGDLGLSPGTSITGFGPGIVIGTIHQTDAVATNAQAAATTAFNALAAQSCDFGPSAPTDLAGQTLVPGVYCYSSSVQISGGGVLTLDANGDPNAAWIFKIGSTLTTISGASVDLIDGAQACNVFWQVGSSATIGTSTTFAGNIIALESVTLATSASLTGRAFALTGAVTMDTNPVSVCSLAAQTPTLGKAFTPATINAGGVSTLTITLSNPDATVATLTDPLIDTLPNGVVIATTPNASTTCGGAVTASAGGSTVTLSAGNSIPANGTCTVTVNVTAAAGGSYINTLPAGALMTSNGNNAAPAVATLTVVSLVPPPTLGKAFSPASINAGGVSTLTITLSNPNLTAATLTSPLIDTLPPGVVIAPTPNASNTCGGVVTAIAGGTTVTLTGGAIPGGSPGTCTVTVNVIAAAGGSYINNLPAGALVTSKGNNTLPTVATLTVVSLRLTTVSSQASSGVTLGGAISDTATLSGGTTPTGTITFNLYGPNDTTCAGTVIFTSTVAVSGNGVYGSGSFTPVTPGIYRWIANYSGDANNGGTANACNAANENVVVADVRAALTALTSQASPAVTLGAAITDTATLSGGANPTGTITFNLYGPNDATCASTVIFTSTVAVSGNGVYGSGSFTPVIAGTYRWIANYSGDANNAPTANACNAANESVAAARLTPALTSQASPHVTLGGAISDTATLSGGATPTGTITFNLYGPSDATCAGAVIFTSTVAVNGNGAYVSGSFTPTSAGTYRWIANYNGDTNNAPTANACNAANESVAVTTVAVAPIPTLSEWAIIMLAALLALFGVVGIRRYPM